MGIKREETKLKIGDKVVATYENAKIINKPSKIPKEYLKYWL
jgi:hypothetical protein